MTADAVRARIAALMRAPRTESSTRVGAFTLRRAQERALVAILDAVRAFGGVLVADPPGSGKTVLALAAAQVLRDAVAARSAAAADPHRGDRAEVLVVAPAALRAQWHAAADRAALPIAFASFESLSRGRTPARARTLIVDEAHHARTSTTRRYARLAECCVGARVLLLTATPVVNRATDRDSLLALFLGARGAALSPDEAARCVVRTHDRAARPAVRRLGTVGRGVDVPGLAHAIASLPPPLPMVDGAPATALITMSLAMAWRSSLAALDAALRRRIQRGAAIGDILRAGLVPSPAMLRHWVLHDDATQLALGHLLGPPRDPQPTRAAPRGGSEALTTLAAHLDAVADLRTMIRPFRDADAGARADAIRALVRAHPDRRLVVFARHAHTIRALYSELRAEPGVVGIVGTRVLATAGRWTRDELLRAIGPRARPLRADDPRGIRIILATDVVAEGVEMQGVGIIVHADIPWTPARLEQRVGRLTRVGSHAREILEARIGAPGEVRALLRLGLRLHRKADARRMSLRGARAHAAIDATLREWSAAATHAATSSIARTAGLRAGREGFIAVVGDPPGWLVGERREGRWRVGSSPRAVARLLRAARGDPFPPGTEETRDHERRIRLAISRRAALALTAAGPQQGGSSAPPPSTRRRVARVRARFAALLARTPALARAEIAARQAILLARLAGPLALARERRIDALLREPLDHLTFMRRVGALLATDAGHEDERARGPAARLHCLLILRGP